MQLGRPKKKLSDLPNGWELRLLEMGREGMLDVDARVYLGISKDTFYRLLDEEPNFSEAVNAMREASHTWWASIPRKGFKDGTSKNLNSNLYSLVMRNKFGDEWNTEKKVDITSGGEKIEGTKKYEIEIIKKTIEDNE
jgi:hypothetical protein